jgi:hypothetical protein
MIEIMRMRSLCLAGLLSALGTGAMAADGPWSQSQASELDQLVNDHPDDFAGLSVDEKSGKIVVLHARSRDKAAIEKLLAGTSKPFRSNAALAGQGPDKKERTWKIETRPVTRSLRELEKVFARIDKAEPWQSMVQPVLVGWAIDTDNNVVVVNVTEVSPALAATANRLFGAAVELREVPRDNIRYTRSNDTTPWYGGIPIQGSIPDAVLTSQIGQCTAGFAVTESLEFFQGLLTAGHCFGDAAIISQKSDNKERVGMVMARELKSGGLDYALVGWGPQDPKFGTGTGYGTRVWLTENRTMGHVSDQVLLLVPSVGTVVCFNGAFTGERCNAKISSMTSCQVLTPWTSTCSLVTVVSTDGRRIAGRGDSGGPVYTHFGDTTFVPRGLIVGGNADGTVVYYHQLKTIFSALQGSASVGGFPWKVIR